MSSTDHDVEVELRVVAADAGRPPGSDWSVGYILRNEKGEDIASANSQIERTDLGPLEPSEEALVQVRIRLPQLAPGSYSLSPTVAYTENGRWVLSDQLDNALVFQITALKDVYCILSLETSFARAKSPG